MKKGDYPERFSNETGGLSIWEIPRANLGEYPELIEGNTQSDLGGISRAKYPERIQGIPRANWGEYPERIRGIPRANSGEYPERIGGIPRASLGEYPERIRGIPRANSGIVRANSGNTQSELGDYPKWGLSKRISEIDIVFVTHGKVIQRYYCDERREKIPSTTLLYLCYKKSCLAVSSPQTTNITID